MANFLTWITAALVFTCMICRTWAHGHSHSPSNSPKVVAFRQKWGVNEIVRDVDHIREDLSQMMEMQNDGLISQDEALFYFFRIHDFDDNGQLDGLEIIAAVSHGIEHLAETEGRDSMLPIEEMTDVVDGFFQFDLNSDGFVSYTEMKTRLGQM